MKLAWVHISFQFENVWFSHPNSQTLHSFCKNKFKLLHYLEVKRSQSYSSWFSENHFGEDSYKYIYIYIIFVIFILEVYSLSKFLRNWMSKKSFRARSTREAVEQFKMLQSLVLSKKKTPKWRCSSFRPFMIRVMSFDTLFSLPFYGRFGLRKIGEFSTILWDLGIGFGLVSDFYAPIWASGWPLFLGYSLVVSFVFFYFSQFKLFFQKKKQEKKKKEKWLDAKF